MTVNAEDLEVGQAFYDVQGRLATVEHEPVLVYGGGVVRVHCVGRRPVQMEVGTKVEVV